MQTLPSPAVIDLKAIAELRALNPDDGDEFLREIVGIFLADTPERITELEESLATGDVAKFTRAAHSIKGSSSNLGAAALRAVAEALEHRTRTQGLTGAEAFIPQVRAEFARTQAELSAIVGR
jgi:HPt (histidine-containing phosphotransfer) domain-containing protein